MNILRILSATVHHDSNEIEIVVEKEGDKLSSHDDRLFTMWVDAVDVVENGQEWVKPKRD